MATLRDHVRGNLGETYEVLTDTGKYDGRNKPDVVGDKIAVVTARWTPVGTDPETLNEFVKSVLADLATRLVIPIAIDYYMVQTRLVDNASRPPGVTPLGGEVGQNYDRVQTLLSLDEMLKNRIAADLPSILPEIGVAGSVGYGVRTTPNPGFRTQEPDAFPRIGRGNRLYVGFGVMADVAPATPYVVEEG